MHIRWNNQLAGNKFKPLKFPLIFWRRNLFHCDLHQLVAATTLGLPLPTNPRRVRRGSRVAIALFVKDKAQALDTEGDLIDKLHYLIDCYKNPQTQFYEIEKEIGD